MVREVIGTHLGFSGTLISQQACMYTMSPDEHFILDHHPDHSNVSFVAGLSGHGFKFAPILGQALADLCLDARSPLPIEFLSLQRFSRDACEASKASPGKR